MRDILCVHCGKPSLIECHCIPAKTSWQKVTKENLVVGEDYYIRIWWSQDLSHEDLGICRVTKIQGDRVWLHSLNGLTEPYYLRTVSFQPGLTPPPLEDL